MNKENSIGFIPDRFEYYEVEAEKIIRWLKTDPKFCHDFFFGNNPKMCNIAQLRSNLSGYFKQNYNVVVSPKDFSTIVYQTLWSEGTWSKLDSYDKHFSFYFWLKKVARAAVLERLAEERIILSIRSRTPGNTRLALLSQPVEMCKLIIDEQLPVNKYHDFMCSIYVSRLKKEEIMKQYSMTEQEFDDAKYKGEYALKDALLRSNCGYEEDVLRDKTRNDVGASLDFGADMEEWMRNQLGEGSLMDVFGVNLTDEEIREKVIDLLYGMSAKMNWNDRDRFLWRQRFVHDTPPVKLATALGRSRAWVDTRYSQLNDRIEPSLKRWWAANAA